MNCTEALLKASITTASPPPPSKLELWYPMRLDQHQLSIAHSENRPFSHDPKNEPLNVNTENSPALAEHPWIITCYVISNFSRKIWALFSFLLYTKPQAPVNDPKNNRKCNFIIKPQFRRDFPLTLFQFVILNFGSDANDPNFLGKLIWKFRDVIAKYFTSNNPQISNFTKDEENDIEIGTV